MRRLRRTGTFVCLAASLVGVWAGAAQSVVVRHDRPDSETLQLGERFAAVGRVLPDGGCTLIAPTWIATAAHVAAGVPHDGRVRFGDREYAVKQVVIHPEGTAPEGVPPEVDLALIELAEAVEGVEPVELYRGRDELGRTLFIVGYGDHGSPSAALARADGRRRAVTNVVTDAGPRRIFMVFDEPPPGSALEGVGGPGDSGGPALIVEGDRVFLAGVSSASMNGRPGQYGVTDVYTRISSYAEWIEKTVGAR